MNQSDKRVLKTKKALHKALAELLAEKDIGHITVKEVSDKAEVHRVTFYSHYQDIYMLYEELKESALLDISELVSANEKHDYEQYYELTTEYFHENRWVAQLVFTDASLQTQVLDILKENYLKIWLFEDHVDHITEDMKYMTAYNIEGCAAILKEWWRGGFTVSKDKIVSYLRRANKIFDAVTLIR